MNKMKFFAYISLITLFSFFIAGESLSSEKTLVAESVVKGEQEKVAKEEALIKEKYPNAIRTSSGLMYIILKEGNGATPTSGALIEAHYTGRLLDGTKFDSSVDRGKPFLFVVGKGDVIKGWDEAFLSMKKGEKRILIIPPGLAYGDKGMRTIPPNETLIFEVELINFLK
ncbi:MAG: FKBP-type peptidyl-prolyl cis-trans isomerase [Smithella sp.]|jgi:peptidylprolyl isomerase